MKTIFLLILLLLATLAVVGQSSEKTFVDRAEFAYILQQNFQKFDPQASVIVHGDLNEELRITSSVICGNYDKVLWFLSNMDIGKLNNVFNNYKFTAMCFIDINRCYTLNDTIDILNFINKKKANGTWKHSTQ
jgi:hypothetical protein